MSFRQQVYSLVRQIPSGKVATYGQIAALVGNPRASRQVGFALRSLGITEADVPWWRVVNKQGYISINHGQGGAEKEIQRQLLSQEGIIITDDLIVNLAEYLWHNH